MFVLNHVFDGNFFHHRVFEFEEIVVRGSSAKEEEEQLFSLLS